MGKTRLLDIFMCLIILSYSIWLFLILLNGKTHSNKKHPERISFNTSCHLINSMYFVAENLVCDNRLISPNQSLNCYDDEERLIEYHLSRESRDSSKVTDQARLERDDFFCFSFQSELIEVCRSDRIRYSFVRSHQRSQSLVDLLLFFVTCALISVGISVSVFILCQLLSSTKPT